MATRKPAVTNEQIISALLTTGTQRGAARQLGIDEKTVYNRMNSGEFVALYTAARADIIRGAVTELERSIISAVDTVCEIMENEETNPAIRLQAAQTILNNASKYGERLRDCEHRVKLQEESNKIDFDALGL